MPEKLVTLAGIVTLVRPALVKAKELMPVKPDGNSMLARELQSAKQLAPSVVTEFGSVTLVRFEQE